MTLTVGLYIVLSAVMVILSELQPSGSPQRLERLVWAVVWAVLAVAFKKDRGE